MLNPWELLNFSKEKKIAPKEFKELYTELELLRGEMSDLSNKFNELSEKYGNLEKQIEGSGVNKKSLFKCKTVVKY